MRFSELEIWKEIPNLGGVYFASSKGRIKSVARIDESGHHRGERILNGRKDRAGYIYLTIRKNNKRMRALAHRLVASAFIDNVYNKPCINHIDNNTSNNCPSNLEWCTYKENSYHRDIQGRHGDVSGQKNYMFGRTKEKCPNYGDKSYRARLILDVANGVFYNCVREAAEFSNINYNTLKARLHESGNYRNLQYV